VGRKFRFERYTHADLMIVEISSRFYAGVRIETTKCSDLSPESGQVSQLLRE
jgi:hypothetical protein